MNAKARAGFPLALGTGRRRTREKGGEVRIGHGEDRSRNVVALLTIGLLTESATLAYLIYAIFF